MSGIISRTEVLNEEEIEFINNLPEVKIAKEKLNNSEINTIYFSINLNEEIREKIYNNFGLDLRSLETIPMRWIKGDTLPHIDRGIKDFTNTYLIYLTDSPGELVVDGNSYEISKGTGYVFEEGLNHKTINTGNEPRLLLGPMSEDGFKVGAATIITADGETETIYIRYDEGSGTTYKINNGPYQDISLPLTIVNSNISFTLKVLFETDLILSSNIWYIICGSDNIQFGSTSLKNDGTRRKIFIDNVTNYPGLIQNGFFDGLSINNGNNKIYVYNIEVKAINGSTLVSDGGWIGQFYFGVGASENYILNCSSTGPIIDGGGGIVGGYAGSETGATLYITGCSSDGDLGEFSGGIIGFYAGRNSGLVRCESCWSLGIINNYSGGIIGYEAGNNLGNVTASKCYSIGTISGTNAGGIFGQLAGTAGLATAEKCYSQGVIGSDAGGIFGGGAGSDSGITNANNCYSSGILSNPVSGIYKGGIITGRNIINCYIAEGDWIDSDANSSLIGTPNPTVGITWVSTGENQPYELANMGYTPYTITNITTTPSPNLLRNYSATVSPGNTTLPAIISGKSYTKLQITGGNSGSYGTITINNSTGVISTTSSTQPGTYAITLRNTGSYNITTFELEVSGYIICYNEDTKVLAQSINGEKEYIKIQDLRPNDLVETYKHGLLPIKQIGNRTLRNGKTPFTSMYKIPKNENMTEDLIVSGSHNILMDRKPNNKSIYHKKRTIDGKYRILASDLPQAEQIKDNNEYTLYHIVIEGQNPRYGIYVNGGLIAETTTESDYKKFGFKSL